MNCTKSVCSSRSLGIKLTSCTSVVNALKVQKQQVNQPLNNRDMCCIFGNGTMIQLKIPFGNRNISRTIWSFLASFFIFIVVLALTKHFSLETRIKIMIIIFLKNAILPVFRFISLNAIFRLICGSV